MDPIEAITPYKDTTLALLLEAQRRGYTLHYFTMSDLFVADGARNLGIGRRLIEHVCEAAKAAGCSRVHWLTHETNTDAMQLYDRIAEKSGFVQYRKIL